MSKIYGDVVEKTTHQRLLEAQLAKQKASEAKESKIMEDKDVGKPAGKSTSKSK